MKAHLQAVTAILLVGSATSALCQQPDNAAQTAQEWRAKAVASKCITYDPNDWQYYPLNFRGSEAQAQAQPNGTGRLRPKC